MDLCRLQIKPNRAGIRNHGVFRRDNRAHGTAERFSVLRDHTGVTAHHFHALKPGGKSSLRIEDKALRTNPYDDRTIPHTLYGQDLFSPDSEHPAPDVTAEEIDAVISEFFAREEAPDASEEQAAEAPVSEKQDVSGWYRSLFREEEITEEKLPLREGTGDSEPDTEEAPDSYIPKH